MRPARCVAVFLVVAAIAKATGAAMGQEPLRAGLMGKPRVGAPAPDFVLPYFTAGGPGPADQPFRRSAELGRVLVIVFGPVGDAGWWQGVAAAADTAWSGAFPVGVVRGLPAEVARIATGLPTDRLKLLADRDGEAGRKYGIGRTDRAAFVVADDGTVVLGRGRFDPATGGSVAAISGALRSLVPPKKGT